MPSHAAVSRPGSVIGAFFGSFLVGCERVVVPREPERARAFEDLVLVAMQRRYPWPATSPRSDARQ